MPHHSSHPKKQTVVPAWCLRRLATLKHSHWVSLSCSWQAMISLKRSVLARLDGVLHVEGVADKG